MLAHDFIAHLASKGVLHNGHSADQAVAPDNAVNTASDEVDWLELPQPDLIPTSDDIDFPEALIERISGGSGEQDDMDRAIEDLLNDEGDDRPKE